MRHPTTSTQSSQPETLSCKAPLSRRLHPEEMVTHDVSRTFLGKRDAIIMLLLDTTPQGGGIFTILERDWHDDVVVFLREKLPKLLVVFLILFILQRIVLFFVHRLQQQADKQVGNFLRAGQLRTI